MKQPGKRSREGVVREDANTADPEGLIAPSIGALEQALYFTTAPSVSEKAKQVIKDGRLSLPGVVVVWDETIGRRRGAKAIPKGWWADAGSLTAAFAFPPSADNDRQEYLPRAAEAVVRMLETFRPNSRIGFQPPNDLILGGKRLGAVFVEPQDAADLVIVRLNCTTDLTKAPRAIAATACRLIDFINVRQLPLQKPETLANTVLTHLMVELPRRLGHVS